MKNVLTILFVLFTVILCAQVPEKMSYQAVIRDNANQLIKASRIGMKISILQTSVSGLPVYVETLNPVTNDNGLVSVEIGNGTSQLGNFGDINWSSGVFYIKTEIDPIGGNNYNIESTSQLLSVPYALYAKNVENVNASNIVGDIQPDSNGIGIITGNGGYVFSNGQWYFRSLSGTPQEMISTNNNIGIITSNNNGGYVFSNGQWYFQSLNGIPQKIIGNNGNIGIITSSNNGGYIFSNSQWYFRLLNGTPTEIVANQGVFGIMTSNGGYAFNNGQWYFQLLSGTPQKIIAKSGKILIYTNSNGYIFDKTTNQWYFQSLNGNPLDYAH